MIDQVKFDVREKGYERVQKRQTIQSAYVLIKTVNKLFLERLVGVELTIDPGE